MTTAPMRCAVVASTGGSVLGVLLKEESFRRHVALVVTDRECGALAVAARHGIETVTIVESDNARFSAALRDLLQEKRIDLVISFFTRLFTSELLEAYPDRVVNLHPSILPAFKGLHGFEDAMAHGARYVGTTIHFVDEAMDEGRIIQQTAVPVNPAEGVAALRHRLFVHQCRSLLQVVAWLAAGRVDVVDGRVVVDGARFDDIEFVPALEAPAALALRIPPSPSVEPDQR